MKSFLFTKILSFVAILSTIYLNSCSFIFIENTFESEVAKNPKGFTQINKNFIRYGYRAVSFQDSINSAFKFSLGAYLNESLVSFGPPILPVIPNIFGLHGDDSKLYIDFKFDPGTANIQIDPTKVYFYESLTGKQIHVDTVKFINSSNYLWIDEQLYSQSYFSTPILNNQRFTLDSTTYIRYNLDTKFSNMKSGLLIKFGDGFVNIDSIKIEDLYLNKKKKPEYIPIMLGV